jgi:preprotein translocase subunit SecD
VVFLFTKPTVTLLARTKFFGGGHRFSGFSPEQLGRVTTSYAGRGRVRTPGESIAARRAAQLAEAESANSPDSDDDYPAPANGTVSAGSSTGRSSRTGRSTGNRRDA